MDKLKSIIIYFLKHSSKTLGRTDLMKFLYCFEYYYVQTFGKQYSDLNFTRYKFGPHTSQVFEAVDELKQEEIISISRSLYSGGKQFFAHKLIHNSPKREYYKITPEAEHVAGFILYRLGNSNYEEIIDFSYSTPPMSTLLKSENKENTFFYGRRLNLKMSKKVFKMTREQKENARLRMNKRVKVKGSDSEYYKDLLKTYKDFESTRRRVNECLN